MLLTTHKNNFKKNPKTSGFFFRFWKHIQHLSNKKKNNFKKPQATSLQVNTVMLSGSSGEQAALKGQKGQEWSGTRRVGQWPCWKRHTLTAPKQKSRAEPVAAGGPDRSPDFQMSLLWWGRFKGQLRSQDKGSGAVEDVAALEWRKKVTKKASHSSLPHTSSLGSPLQGHMLLELALHRQLN